MYTSCSDVTRSHSASRYLAIELQAACILCRPSPQTVTANGYSVIPASLRLCPPSAQDPEAPAEAGLIEWVRSHYVPASRWLIIAVRQILTSVLNQEAPKACDKSTAFTRGTTMAAEETYIYHQPPHTRSDMRKEGGPTPFLSVVSLVGLFAG